MPDQHALLSASAAERWMNCPGSVAATKDLPNKPSVYADEGTLAHSLCELKVRKLFGIPEPMKRSVWTREWNKIKADPLYQPEMENCSDTYIEHIQSVVMSFPVRPFIAVEQQVSFDEYVPEGFGTSDCIVVYGDELHIIDYKHGQGVPVSAVDNKQLKLYALGAYLYFHTWFPGIKRVVLHVVQPRLNNISVWETTVSDLLDWAENDVKPAAKLALSDNAPFVPGESQCRFCGIRATCRARMENAKAVKNSPIFGKVPPELTDAEVGEALTMGKLVADWLKKLESYASKKLESGGAIPGYKLVEGRTTRVWDDQNAAFADMRQHGIDDALLYERNPITVAKLEKVLDKKVFAQVVEPHIVRSPGKPTMVPESDTRKPWSAAKADFADILKAKGE